MSSTPLIASSKGAITLFCKSFRTGAIIGGTHHNGWRSNIGILFDGQTEQPDDTHNDNRNEMTADNTGRSIKVLKFMDDSSFV